VLALLALGRRGAGLPRFPLPFLRRAYLAGAYLVYTLKDR
jgi:hypothetical protein